VQSQGDYEFYLLSVFDFVELRAKLVDSAVAKLQLLFLSKPKMNFLRF